MLTRPQDASLEYLIRNIFHCSVDLIIYSVFARNDIVRFNDLVIFGPSFINILQCEKETVYIIDFTGPDKQALIHALKYSYQLKITNDPRHNDLQRWI